MPQQLIILKFKGNSTQSEELKKAIETLMQYASIDQIKTLADAVKRNPQLIKNAIKFVG